MITQSLKTSILTSYVGKTACRTARIKATAAMGQSVMVSRHIGIEETDEQYHRRAALALCKKMGWDGDMIAGGIKGGYVFVFADSLTGALRAVEAQRERFQAGGRGGEVMGAVSAAMDMARDALGVGV